METTDVAVRRTDPIQVFIGSAGNRIVEERVLVDSILRHTDAAVEIHVIDGPDHVVRDPGTGAETPLPDHWRGYVEGRSGFTFARFAPPELCGFAGRAIYLECDQVLLGDIAELWNHDLGGASVGAAFFARQRGPANTAQVHGIITGVLLYDCSRCSRLTVESVCRGLERGHHTYREILDMDRQFLDEYDLDVAELPPRWNDLEIPHDDTVLLHFTNGRTRPCRYPNHPGNTQWRTAYLDCVADGELSTDVLDQAHRNGWISTRTRRLAQLPRPVAGSVDGIWQQVERAMAVVRRTGRPVTGPVRRIARRIGARMRLLAARDRR